MNLIMDFIKKNIKWIIIGVCALIAISVFLDNLCLNLLRFLNISKNLMLVG